MADDLDLLTLTEAKRAINMKTTNDDHDAELEQDITAISRIFDAVCGPVVKRTVSNEVHQDGDVCLRLSPVLSVTQVLESDVGTIGTLTAAGFGSTADGYYAEPHWNGGGTLLSGVIQRRYLGVTGSWPSGVEVKVTYEAGRYANTASVDARFKACAGAVLQRFWKGEAGIWAQSSASIYEASNEVQSSPELATVARSLIKKMLPDETRLPGHA